MNNKSVQISPWQFTILTSMFVVGSAVLFIPTILASVAKQDAWISCLIAIIVGVLLAWFYGSFSKIDPNLSYFELAVFALGKWVGRCIALVTLSLHLVLSSFLLWDIGDFLVTQILVGTPIEVIYYLFIFVTIVYGVRLGIEPIARSAEIFIPWIFLIFIFIVIFLLPEAEAKNLFPIFEEGVRPILYGSYYVVGFPFVEMVLLLMITPHVSDKKKVTSAFIWGVVLGGAILFSLTLLSILVLGPDFSTRNEFPIYVLVKKISIGNFLERIEVLIALIWFLSIFFKLALVSYSFLIGMSQLFNLKDYRPLTFPFGILVIVLTLIMIPSSIYLKAFSKYASTPYMILIGLILPLVVFIMGKMKKKKSNTMQ
ncbi:endospore germination permease [Bacillus luteolus]|uniref:Endospore germination permease n=1 Tax=Litchfieldia luteola TaxID=682179 RepID=A0ABR9QFR8_9BACI|nr:endospore germination permease [Cytobacillus luteolus]MBE4907332.1 endospore germination permease [Cytobacillus luteolus]MBP1943879.1 spore germination protein KB [Cytobacillus luteolus]